MGRILAGVSFGLISVGAAVPASALNLMGSDTLGDVATRVISDCGLSTSIKYLGRGSGVGQSAMLATPPTQHIAPMSRPLNGDIACPGGSATTQGILDARAEQLLIGLEGIAIVGANQTGQGTNLITDVGFFQCADSILPTGVCNGNTAVQCNVATQVADCGPSVPCVASRVCSNSPAMTCLRDVDCGFGNTCDAITGLTGRPVTLTGLPSCAADGCILRAGSWTYTFNSWKEVLAMIYGGQNNTLNDQFLTTTFPRFRDSAKINCASPVRKALADSWGTLFLLPNNCGYGPQAGNCVKLKHAFRRADSSDTTDTFVALIGMVGIPASSKVVCGTPPNAAIEGVDPSSATAHPFCNAGLSPMNKGWSDYLDLDPIRRISDSDLLAGTRPGLEQVAEGGVPPSNPPAIRGADTRPDPTGVPVELPEHAGIRNNYGPDLCNPATWFANEGTDLGLRKGLGLVLPIEIPTTYVDDNQAYWGVGLPVLCDVAQFAPSLIAVAVAAQFAICPYGTQQGNCLLPVHKNADGTFNFNCMSENAVLAKTIKDERYYNTVVVNAAGKLLFDNYCNPDINVPCTGAINRQARPVTAWYRLHVTRGTNLGGNNLIGSIPPAPAVNTCKTFNATDQIGCLVKANPCSIGFAGRQAVDPFHQNFAYRLGGDLPGTVGAAFAPIPPTENHLVDILDPLATSFYPMSRKLFVNRWVDPNAPEANVADFNNEEALFNCFKNVTGTTISNFHFAPLPTGPTVDNVCPNDR